MFRGKSTFTFHFEAQKGDLTLLAEYQFVDLSPSTGLPDGSTVDVGFKNKMGELGVAYRVAEYGGSELEILRRPLCVPGARSRGHSPATPQFPQE